MGPGGPGGPGPGGPGWGPGPGGPGWGPGPFGPGGWGPPGPGGFFGGFANGLCSLLSSWWVIIMIVINIKSFDFEKKKNSVLCC